MARTAVAILLLLGAVSTGCGGDDADGGADVARVDGLVIGEELYADDFERDTGDWDIVDSDEIATHVEDGDFVWRYVRRFEPKPHMLPTVLGEQLDAGELEMLDVVVRAEVTSEQGSGMFGVFCRESRGTNADFQWYEFVLRDGYSAIRIADTDGTFETLAQTEDVAITGGTPISIEAGCVDSGDQARLTFAIDGEQVLEAVHGDPLGNGAPGLQGYETHNPEEPGVLRWHEFSVVAASAAAE